MTLIEAINIIEGSVKLGNIGQVSMIQYEDGSGSKFVYRLYGESINRFVDLSEIEKKLNAVKEVTKWVYIIGDKDASPLGKGVAAKRISEQFSKIINNQ